MIKKGRWQHRKEELQHQLDLLDEKIVRLERELILAVEVEQEFRLENRIKSAKSKREEIEQALDEVDQHLALGLQSDFEQTKSQKPYIFISYKRDVKPDELVALQVSEALSQECKVFIDQTMPVGTHWAERIEAELRRSDYLITFLSERSIHSEMVLAEIEQAHNLAKEQNGRPVILPVRLAYREPFPHYLAKYLNPINWALWENHSDTSQIIQDLKKAIAGQADLPINDQLKRHIIRSRQIQDLPEPGPSVDPKPIQLQEPGGTMPLTSSFYIERPEDQLALYSIRGQGVTITIRAPRQMGKSSLLMRVVDTALKDDKQVAYIDFQQFDQTDLADANSFYPQFCTWLTEELAMEDRVADFWRKPGSNNRRCTRYIKDYILAELDFPLVLAMDEVDSVFKSDFRNDFFGMLRGWHNNRAHPVQGSIWQQLDLALVTSTEPSLFIEKRTQSPFNVSEPIRLSDFTLDQIADLNNRHRTPLNQIQIQQLLNLLGGHPYLTRRALYLIAGGHSTPTELFNQAADDDGPFGSHLRYYLFRLHGHEDLIQSLRQVISDHSCANEHIYYRLWSAGLVRDEGQDVLPRCQLYADYFWKRLHG